MNNTGLFILIGLTTANLAATAFAAYKVKKTTDELEVQVEETREKMNKQKDAFISTLQKLEF